MFFSISAGQKLIVSEPSPLLLTNDCTVKEVNENKSYADLCQVLTRVDFILLAKLTQPLKKTYA